MQIELDTDTAAIPLGTARFHTRRPARPRDTALVHSHQVAPQAQVKEYRMEVRDADADASILVIGEPNAQGISAAARRAAGSG
jgi:hypothetical protein